MPAIIYCQMCFSIPHCLWMLIDAIISFDQHSHTHTLSLSLSLCYLALFPHLSVSLKSSLCNCLMINWNTDFTVLGCSHFIGSINTKCVCHKNQCPPSSDINEIPLVSWGQWYLKSKNVNYCSILTLVFILLKFSCNVT